MMFSLYQVCIYYSKMLSLWLNLKKELHIPKDPKTYMTAPPDMIIVRRKLLFKTD